METEPVFSGRGEQECMKRRKGKGYLHWNSPSKEIAGK